MTRLFIASAIIIAVLTGCSAGKLPEEKTAQELVVEGNKEYKDGNYLVAMQVYARLRDWYPFSKHATLAEMRIADSRYHLRQYEEAVMTYEEFANLHPRNEFTPYVLYQIGRCHFDQIPSVDRDQTSSQNALDSFKRLIQRFPNDQYANLARAHIIKCQKNIAHHELYVAKFYMKSKKYKAAFARFKSILTAYPDVGIQHEALQYLAECEMLLSTPAAPEKE